MYIFNVYITRVTLKRKSEKENSRFIRLKRNITRIPRGLIFHNNNIIIDIKSPYIQRKM